MKTYSSISLLKQNPTKMHLRCLSQHASYPHHPLFERPDMRYCFRSGRFLPNTRTKHISFPPRHMTKSYIPDFNLISQHYSYKDTTSHTIGIQVPKYITSGEDRCLSPNYKQCLVSKVKHAMHTSTRVQAL